MFLQKIGKARKAESSWKGKKIRNNKILEDYCYQRPIDYI